MTATAWNTVDPAFAKAATPRWATRLSWRGGCVLLALALHGWALTQVPAITAGTTSHDPVGELRLALSLAARPSAPPATEPEPMPASNTEQAPPRQRLAQATAPKPAPTQPALTQPASTQPASTQQTVTQPADTQPKQTRETPAEQQMASDAARPPVVTQPLFAAPPKPPIYPTLARKRGQEGTVWLEVLLAEDGRQLRRTVLTSSGISALDQAALAAVAQWRFQAHRVNGAPSQARVHLPIEFALN